MLLKGQRRIIHLLGLANSYGLPELLTYLLSCIKGIWILIIFRNHIELSSKDHILNRKQYSTHKFNIKIE